MGTRRSVGRRGKVARAGLVRMWGLRVGGTLVRSGSRSPLAFPVWGALRGMAASTWSGGGRPRPRVESRWVGPERMPSVMKEDKEKVRARRKAAMGNWRSVPKGTGGKWAVTGGDVQDGRRASDTVALVPRVRVPERKEGVGWSGLARGNLLGGSDVMFGNKRSEKGKNRSRRAWTPNATRRRVTSDLLGKTWKVRVANRVLRDMERRGGLDNYLLKTTEDRLQSDWATHIREQLLDRMGVQDDRMKRLPRAVKVPPSPYIKVEEKYCKTTYVRPNYTFKGLEVDADKDEEGASRARKKISISKEERAAALAESLAAVA